MTTSTSSNGSGPAARVESQDAAHEKKQGEEEEEESYQGQRAEHEAYAAQHYQIALHQTRCLDNQQGVCAGTIHYVGPVASASDPRQLYAGIIWDDPDQRGKHNGSVVSKRTGRLVRHFECRHHPTAASFVKLEKVRLGIPLTLALLQQRYVDVHHPEWEAPDNVLPHSVMTTRGHAKPIEFYGERKIRQQQQVGGRHLTTVSLRRQGIASVDTTADAWTPTSQNHNDDEQQQQQQQRITQCVHKLDLAGNLLVTWKEALVHVLTVFEALQELSLASNRLAQDLTESLRQALPWPTSSCHHLQNLNLRACHVRSLETLVSLGQTFDRLTVLGLSANPLVIENNDDATPYAALLAQHLSKLQRLDVAECQLSQPHQFTLFSQLPALEWLNFDDNPLSQIPRRRHDAGGDGSYYYFPALEHLQVAGTQLADWRDLDGLRDLTNGRGVASLRLQTTPLNQGSSAATFRSHIIARHAHLTSVNGTPLAPQERVEAERRYVSTVTRHLATLTLDNNNNKDDETDKEEYLAQHHPQYLQLAEKHQTAAAAAAANGSHASSSGLLADRLLSVTLQSMAPQSCEKPPLVRRLPSTLTLGKIKALLARHFGLDVDLQQLSVVAPGGALPTLLEDDCDDDRDLAYCGVRDGSTLLMHEKDLSSQRQQRPLNEDEEFLSRVAQQEAELDDFLQRQKNKTSQT